MLKKVLVVVFVAALAISIIGCGVQNAVGGKPVPPLEGYSKIVIAPIDVKKQSGKYDDLPTMISYGAGNKLSIKFKEKNWYYDQTRDVKPVTDKMNELGLNKKDLFIKPEIAIKLAKAFDADLIVVGNIEEPSFTIERSGKIEYDMKESGPTGAARYYNVNQTAIIRSKLKIIEVSSGKIIWNGDLKSFKRYTTRYKTDQTEKLQRDETMVADIRKEYSDNFVAKLYPERIPGK
jgi:hypothetical protein